MKYKYHPKYKNVKISEDGKTVLKNGNGIELTRKRTKVKTGILTQNFPK